MTDRAPTETDPTAADRPAVRACGRCRASFAGDADLHPRAIPDWWLCPACRAALLPGR